MLSSETKFLLAIMAQAILVSRCYAGPPAMTEEKAFMTPEHKANGWHNEKDGNKRTFPEMVWYQFPVDAAFTPARVSFRPRGSCCLEQAPTMWEFVGSNDQECKEAGNWVGLCEDRSNTAWPSHYFTKYCDVKPEIVSKFRCLGVRVLNTLQKNGVVSLRNVRMWKKVLQ